MINVSFKPKEFCKGIADEIIKQLKKIMGITQEDRWIIGAEAMELLHCKKDKLREHRNNGDIIFNDNTSTILYSRQSIFDFLKQTSNGPI